MFESRLIYKDGPSGRPSGSPQESSYQGSLSKERLSTLKEGVESAPKLDELRSEVDANVPREWSRRVAFDQEFLRAVNSQIEFEFAKIQEQLMDMDEDPKPLTEAYRSYSLVMTFLAGVKSFLDNKVYYSKHWDGWGTDSEDYDYNDVLSKVNDVISKLEALGYPNIENYQVFGTKIDEVLSDLSSVSSFFSDEDYFSYDDQPLYLTGENAFWKSNNYNSVTMNLFHNVMSGNLDQGQIAENFGMDLLNFGINPSRSNLNQYVSGLSTVFQALEYVKKNPSQAQTYLNTVIEDSALTQLQQLQARSESPDILPIDTTGRYNPDVSLEDISGVLRFGRAKELYRQATSQMDAFYETNFGEGTRSFIDSRNNIVGKLFPGKDFDSLSTEQQGLVEYELNELIADHKQGLTEKFLIMILLKEIAGHDNERAKDFAQNILTKVTGFPAAKVAMITEYIDNLSNCTDEMFKESIKHQLVSELPFMVAGFGFGSLTVRAGARLLRYGGNTGGAMMRFVRNSEWAAGLLNNASKVWGIRNTLSLIPRTGSFLTRKVLRLVYPLVEEGSMLFAGLVTTETLKEKVRDPEFLKDLNETDLLSLEGLTSVGKEGLDLLGAVMNPASELNQQNLSNLQEYCSKNPQHALLMFTALPAIMKVTGGISKSVMSQQRYNRVLPLLFGTLNAAVAAGSIVSLDKLAQDKSTPEAAQQALGVTQTLLSLGRSMEKNPTLYTQSDWDKFLQLFTLLKGQNLAGGVSSRVSTRIGLKQISPVWYVRSTLKKMLRSGVGKSPKGGIGTLGLNKFSSKLESALATLSSKSVTDNMALPQMLEFVQLLRNARVARQSAKAGRPFEDMCMDSIYARLNRVSAESGGTMTAEQVMLRTVTELNTAYQLTPQSKQAFGRMKTEIETHAPQFYEFLRANPEALRRLDSVMRPESLEGPSAPSVP